MKKINYFLMAIMTLMISSCCCPDDWDWDDENSKNIEGRGDIVTESIPLSGFTGVELRMEADLTIATGRSYFIDFTAYENIQKYLNARVVNNILILEFSRNISIESDKKIKINIGMPEINDVFLKGVGDIYIHGPAHNQLDMVIEGVGNIDAYSLPLQRSDVRVNGKGNVKLKVSNTLDVIINGIGNVYYKGSPSISSTINGIGELVKD
jgi:hypothetical protein